MLQKLTDRLILFGERYDAMVKDQIIMLKNFLKSKKNYFKGICLVFACAFIFTGCINQRDAEERVPAESQKEESEAEKQETEQGSNSMERDDDFER